MSYPAVIERLQSRRALDRALDRALEIEAEVKAANRETAASHVPSQASQSSLDVGEIRRGNSSRLAKLFEAEVENKAEAESGGSSDDEYRPFQV